MVAGLLALLILGFVTVGGVKGLTGVGCSSSERAVLEEFPHYGDQWFEPYSAEASCVVRYAIDANADEVLGHYDKRWHENGWEKADLPEADLPPSGAEYHFACRNPYTYRVEYTPPSWFTAGERFSPGGYPEGQAENQVFETPTKVEQAVVDVEVSDGQPSPQCLS
jgi:hypothetical protein